MVNCDTGCGQYGHPGDSRAELLARYVISICVLCLPSVVRDQFATDQIVRANFCDTSNTLPPSDCNRDCIGM